MSNVEVMDGAFTDDVAARLYRSVRHARSMLRSLMGAVEAQVAAVVNFEDSTRDAGRWQPLTYAVCEELRGVRSLFIEGGNTPSADWMAPLAQAEALDAALWCEISGEASDKLSGIDVFDAAEALVDSLDKLVNEVSSAQRAVARNTATVATH